MQYVVSIEGQNIQLPAGIGERDEDVKRAMAPFFPEVANAMLTRKTEGETTTITVVKRAGSKGLAGLAYLDNCAGGVNPAVALYQDLQKAGELVDPDPAYLLELDARVDQALKDGEDQAKAVEYAANRLARAVASPAPILIEGF